MRKYLKTREALLEKEQIKKYLAQIASSNSISKESSVKTYPLKRVKENYEYIYLVYKLLNEHVKMHITIHPAGEWLLDNFYIIEQSAKTAMKELSKSKYKKLPGIKNNGYARLYILANEIVINTDGKITMEDLQEYIEAYQTQKYLSMEEIWNVGLYLQICIIEKIRYISEKILNSQIQKVKAQNIVERIIEKKPIKKFSPAVESKYSFIEYMSYKLRKYGKISIPYISALEEELNKSGTTIEEVIKREHFDIAIKTLSMKNCITSIKTISRLDFSELFNRVSISEKILCKDPADVYNKMDYKTRSYYREELLELSKRTKLSEIFIANQILKICKEKKEKTASNDKETHIGYYLINEGKKELLLRIINKKIRFVSFDQKAGKYIVCIFLFSILSTLLLIKTFKLSALFLYVPLQNAITQIIQYIISKKRKIRIIPKMDYTKGIPQENSTMCIIPSILNSEKDIDELFEKMEVYYLANKSENLYFTLLGDCSQSNKQKEAKDKVIIKKGEEVSKRLNEKYGEKFFFIYRKRIWSDSEKSFMGWERKRGLIIQFNNYLLTGKSDFLANTITKIPQIKYVITLDRDTNLVLNTVSQLVGAMSHILNKPEVDRIKNIVVKGHAIIQPHIGVDIEDGRKTVFSRLFAGNGGTDIYSNAISDVYQDEFDEGIYTGKGIYDLKIFNQVLKDEIPEKKVLSHDLLEGNYLRCGLASDIVLMDGYPAKYNSYKLRMHRWIRGDIQIIGWLKSRINGLSKYKIVDNIIRNLNEKDVFLTYLLLLLTMHKYLVVPFIVYATPTIIKLVDNLINRREGTIRHKLFSANFSKCTQSILKLVVDLFIIPDIAILQMNAIIKALYRMFVSHNLLLEWTTSDEAEKKTTNTYISYLKSMMGESIIAVLIILYLINNIQKLSLFNQIIAITLSTMWALSSIVMWRLSKKTKSKIEINNKDKELLISISEMTWKFFKENYINGLPIDNYQENKEEKQALRTSPTNIGLSLISTIVSYDLNLESKDNVIRIINETIKAVDALPKWNGHLYNWYDLKTLEPMVPLDISSVDNGNFIGYLYVTKQFLLEIAEKEADHNKKGEMIATEKCKEEMSATEKSKEETISIIDKLIKETNFEKLYNYENGLFSIGFNVEQNKLYDSYYDLLASESRQTSLIAIAKKDIPVKHWSNLGRTITKVGEHKGLISWGGTAFEYLMPNINIPTYPSSLIDESCRILIQSNKEYAKKVNTPWGISESAYSLKDLSGNYQYKTFGIPWLGLKRGLEDDLVISPYSCALALNIDPKSCIQNLKKLINEGMIGRYGLYEAIDYKPKKEIVKTFMAHHQGMILASIDNAINGNILQKRFMKNAEIKGIKYLLQENMPENVIIAKEKKEKIKRINYTNNKKISIRSEGINVISNGKLSNIIDDKGKNYTKFEDKTVYKDVKIYLKNINSNKIYDINNIIREKICNSKIEFESSNTRLTFEDGTVKTTVKTTIVPDKQIEVKKITIENRGIVELSMEVNTCTEPILQNIKDFSAHPTFNKMFLKYEYHEPKVLLTRKTRSKNEQPLSLCMELYSDEGKAEFEIDKEKYITRNNEEIPNTVKLSKPLTNSIEQVLNPIIAFRKIVKLKPEEKKVLYLISSVDSNKQEAEKNLDIYSNNEKLDRVFEITKEQAEAEIRYRGIKENDIDVYQNMARILMYSKQKAFNLINKDEYNLNTLDLSNNKLWRYGVSGDYPLIVIKVKNRGDYDIIMEVLKAYEYLNSKNIRLEVIILTSNEIKQQIINEKILRYINTAGGIYILDELKYEEIKIIELRAAILLDSYKGSLRVQIEELNKKDKDEISAGNEERRLDKDEEKKKQNLEKGDYQEIVKYNASKNKTSRTKLIKTDYKKLKYENGYGSFNNEGNEYWIKQSKEKRIPIAWSNILANEKFGSVITDNQGGFTWYKNSQSNKITKFSNDAYEDKPSEQIIIKGFEEPSSDYYTGFAFGYVHFIKETDELEQNLTTYVPVKDSVKVSVLQIKNKKDKEIKLDIKYDLKLLLANNNNNSIIVENHKKNLNMIFFNNLMNNYYTTYITSSEKIDKNKEIHINLKPKEEKEIVFLIGAECSEMKSIEVATGYLNSYDKEFEKTINYWNDTVSKIKSKTPLKSFDIMQNGFLVYQTLVSRMIGRTGYYQSSGGYGFRDQLQDAMGMKWINPDILKNQILLHARHQFEEGDVEHWWHEDSGLGIRSRYSDDLLWLVYAVEEYIDFTGDYNILEEKESFIKADELLDNECDRVGYFTEKTDRESIFEHCLRAIRMASKLGNHNLPIIKHGDWNDGMNGIGEKGIGESVWLGFFMYIILNKFVEILKYKDNKSYTNYKQEIEILTKTSLIIKKALNTNAWDGRWYIRAFNDRGEKIGSISNEECKIDSICQSFSVISNGGDNDKRIIAMESLENYLIDNENNLIKLLTPALEKSNLGYISSYSKGMRENGGQYTHVCCSCGQFLTNMLEIKPK